MGDVIRQLGQINQVQQVIGPKVRKLPNVAQAKTPKAKISEGEAREMLKHAVSESMGRRAYIARKAQQGDVWKGMTATPQEREGLVRWMDYGKERRYTRHAKGNVERDRYGAKGDNFPRGTKEQVAAGKERMKGLMASLPEDKKILEAERAEALKKLEAKPAAKPSLLRRLFGRR